MRFGGRKRRSLQGFCGMHHWSCCAPLLQTPSPLACSTAPSPDGATANKKGRANAAGTIWVPGMQSSTAVAQLRLQHCGGLGQPSVCLQHRVLPPGCTDDPCTALVHRLHVGQAEASRGSLCRREGLSLRALCGEKELPNECEV